MISFPILAPLVGEKLDYPEQFLRNNFSSPYSRNMEFVNGRLQSRLGLAKMNATQLPDEVLLITQYWKNVLTWFFMAATKRDLAYYDFANSRYVYITPVYTTGTIEVKAGELNKVYGTDTSWNGNLKAGDFFKIGSGDIHTGSTWYEIESVDSDTLLTLKTNAVVTAAGANYVARQTFTGSDDDFWDEVTFEDKNLGTIWIATNGVDVLIRWDGTGQVAPLASLPTNLTAAKFIEVFKDRLCLLFVTVSGEKLPKVGYWSEVADCEDWDDANVREFQGDDWISGTCIFSNYWIVFKERCAYVGRWVGGTYIFDFDMSTQAVGCNAAHSIIVTNGGIYYYGIDNKFHFFNILEDASISDDILPYTKEFNPNLETKIYGEEWEWRNQLRWIIPYGDAGYMNAVVVFDYNEKIWEIWEYAHPNALVCIGSYVATEQLYVDDPLWVNKYVDEETGYWDDRIFLEGAPIMVYGGIDGYIRRSDIGNDDDGYTFNRIFRTKRIDYRRPDIYKRLWQQQWWFEKSASASVVVKLCRDDNVDFEGTTKTISLDSATKDVIKQPITWDKEAVSFQFQAESTSFFSLLGFLNFLFPKRKVAR